MHNKNKKTAAGEQALFEACQESGLTPEQFLEARTLLFTDDTPAPSGYGISVRIEGPRVPMSEVMKSSGIFM